MLILAVALLLPLAQPLPAPSPQQGEPIRITCNTKSSPQQVNAADASPEGIYRCTNGAQINFRDFQVEADWLAFNRTTMELTAGDQVKFTRGAEVLNGGMLFFNVETKTGTLANVSGQVEGFYMKADLAERLPTGQWRMRQLAASACKGDCPYWGLNIREAMTNPNEGFVGRGLTFRVRNFPILWFPKLTVRSKSERHSGFLMPGYGQSDTKGRSIKGSYFWAINRSADLTFTGEYFSKRGPTGTIDFAATPNANTLINVSEFFAIDREGSGGHRTRIKALSDLSKSWRGVANVDITSDFPFRQVFEDGFNVISSPIEQSQGFLTNNRQRSSLNILYNRQAVFYPDQSVALRKFPSVEYQLPTNSLSRRIPIYFNLETGFTGMARRDNQINTPAFMQRVVVHPTLEIPVLRSSLLTWSHSVGVRDTMYTHSLNPGVERRTLNRGAFDYTMSVTGPQLEKSFGTWKHVFEPTIDYRYVAGVDDFRQTIVVDETDLVTNTNEIEYGITNRFFGKQEFLTWRIAQKMYFDPTFGGALLPGRRNTLEPLMDLTGFAFSDGVPRRFSPIVSTARLAMGGTSTDIEVDYDTQRNEFRSAGIMGGVNRSLVRTTIGYFFNKGTEIQSPNNQVRGLVVVGTDANRLSAGIGFSYDLYRRIFQGSTAQVYYNADCFGLRFEISQVDLGQRREVGWRVSITLKNLGTVGNLRNQERLF